MLTEEPLEDNQQDTCGTRSPSNDGLVRLGAEILEINKANGWNVCTPDDWENVYKLGTIMALIHSEVSEGLEAIRHGDKLNFEEEMADVIIRVLDCTHGLGIDIEKAISNKLEQNKKRGFRHGGKTC